MKNPLSFSQVYDTLCEHSVAVSGIVESVDSFFLYDLYCRADKKRMFCVVTADQKEAERICAEINGFDPDTARLFPIAQSVPYTMRSTFGPTRETRLQLQRDLLDGATPIVVIPSAALFEPTIFPDQLFRAMIRLHVNQDISPAVLTEWLLRAGFRRETTVATPGTYSQRGGIFDIYAFGVENPIRLEFWGDTIDSIREFDIFRQRSVKAVSSFDILPMKEFLPTSEERDVALDRISAWVSKKRLDLKLYDLIEHSWSVVNEIDGIEWFSHWFDREYCSILSYLSQDAPIIWGDYLTPAERYQREFENYVHHRSRVPEMLSPFVSDPQDLLLAPDALVEDLKRNTCYLKAVPTDLTSHFQYDFVVQPSFAGDIALFMQDLQHKRAQGFSVVLYAETEGLSHRLAEQCAQHDVEIPDIQLAYLKSGFFSLSQKKACYSERQLFDRVVQRKHSTKMRQSSAVLSYDMLSRGDIIVHIDHGIGRYLGIEKVTAGNFEQDCLVLEYRDNSKIRVPITDYHKVQKYIGKESYSPELSKLGSAAWERKKERTRCLLQEMASKMIRLYAKRECHEGVVCGPDTPWQQDFEDSFLYTPTHDQLTSIADIKADLESNRPMDRLVCGDVGFGKTEVAMRAAFKAVMDGFQVAILAPTTVLTLQHGKTFRERMADFPIRIAALSRLTDNRTLTEIHRDLAEGKINILIGTHKILSSTFKFKNLGLLIIDEEQRFGVKQKDQFTQWRHHINVLSMSATPIPRTLHMSMVGIRDLSLINTPPCNRLPVETLVAESHDDLIQQALTNEIERGGQAFVVYNRIEGLMALYSKIERLVPQARIAIGHGQMEGAQLEEVMDRFSAGEFDILISTTIIENGIDIPNANTIIVEEANNLGLSQLYQLRGRVGRSTDQGYAYFFVNSFKRVKEDSLKRLKALEQYTDLGSGFQLAMRDFELRGAGNLLGTAQSGSIAAVGFELYCQLLKEEIARLREQDSQEANTIEPVLRTALQGHFPTEYIADSNLRILLYQRCTAFRTLVELRDFELELQDRFGAYPEQVAELLVFMELKILATRFVIEDLKIQDNAIALTLAGSVEVIQQTCAQFLGIPRGNITLDYGEKVRLKTFIAAGDTPLQQCRTLRNLMKQALRTDLS